MGLTARDKLIVDNQKAQNVAAKYIQAINGELYARGLMLNSASQKFAKFLTLEAIPPWYAPYLSLASAALLVAQPELFLAKFLAEKTTAVKLALTISSAAGSKTAKVVTTVQNVRDAGEKAKEIAGKVKDGVDTLKGAKDGVATIMDPDDAPGAKDIAKLDVSKQLSLTLVAASRSAFTIWSTALDVLAKELENRLSNLNNPKAVPPAESMEAMATRLLQLPASLSDKELSEVELVYLYELVKMYVRAFVKVKIHVEDWTDDGGSRIESVSYEGLNNNQRASIVAMFGTAAQNGKIYKYPAVTDLRSTLISWGASSSQTVQKRMWRGNRI